jgi:MFS family permease
VIGAAPPEGPDSANPLAALRHRPFLLLWLAQAATQIGGNMVLYGLTVVIVSSTASNSAVSALILTFLVPAVLLSAVAGVVVDRVDRRTILVVTNILRAIAILGMYAVGDNILAIFVLNIIVSTLTTFFAPAEASMIPMLVPRSQLISANGIFTLTLNGSFALGFALLGPILVKVAGPEVLLLVGAALYFLAAAFVWTLPSHPPAAAVTGRQFNAVRDAEAAIRETFDQLREGIGYIRGHHNISWSLTYLGISASLVGVVAVLGPDFAQDTLGLAPDDLVVLVLPLGVGIVTGILLLNTYGKYLPRRRVIEGGLIALGILLSVLAIVGPVTRFLQGVTDTSPIDLSGVTSIVAVTIGLGFLAGVAYAVVAIPSQTQLQEDLPYEVRGRVFGVLNMLISVSSFLPIIIVGPISDLVGTTVVILTVAILVGLSGVASIFLRGPMGPLESGRTADRIVEGTAVDSFGVAIRARDGDRGGEQRADQSVEPAAGDDLPPPPD